jgi:hypothetical protein
LLYSTACASCLCVISCRLLLRHQPSLSFLFQLTALTRWTSQTTHFQWMPCAFSPCVRPAQLHAHSTTTGARCRWRGRTGSAPVHTLKTQLYLSKACTGDAGMEGLAILHWTHLRQLSTCSCMGTRLVYRRSVTVCALTHSLIFSGCQGNRLRSEGAVVPMPALRSSTATRGTVSRDPHCRVG